MGTYAPRLYLKYKDTMETVFAHAGLKRNFSNSVFPMCTFNVGPRTVCVAHKDSMNVPGFCLITALGNFDCDKGGELVLWDFGLIIRFPPGSTVAIPSALVYHSNTAIQEGEVRYSMTQYAAGALFRFVENKWKSDVKFMEDDPKGWEEELERRKTQWETFKGLFGKYTDLFAVEKKD